MNKNLRLLTLGFTALFSAIFLWIYINGYVFKTRAGENDINVELAPSEGQFNPGDENVASFIFSAADATKKISGLDITFIGEGNLQIVDIRTAVPFPSGEANFYNSLIERIEASGQRSRASFIVANLEAELPSQVKIELVFKGDSPGSGKLKIDTASSQIVGSAVGGVFGFALVDEGNYTFSGEEVPTATPSECDPSRQECPTGEPTPTGEPEPTLTGGTTPTSTPQGSVVLNLSLRFQGITKKPQDQFNRLQVKVGVTAAGGDAAKVEKTATFAADENGIWKGQVGFDLNPGSNYLVYIKGEKQLQKRFCENDPQETAPGTYSCFTGKIVLNTGINTLDFSKVYLLAGDLPAQDGATDSYDLSYLRQNLNKTDASVLAVGDLNLDGIVNTQDYSLVLAALAFNFDEPIE